MELLAGPWVGEFGWELFSWQAFLRTISKEFDRVTCISRTGRDVLYEDFCDNYIAFDPSGDPDMWWLLSSDTINFRIGLQEQFSSKDIINRQPGHPKRDSVFWMKPNSFGGSHFSEPESEIAFLKDVHPTYIVFGNPLDYDYEYLVFHARGRSFRNSENWSQENWNLLGKQVSQKYKIFCIGDKNDSFYVDGTEDLRGIPLKETVDLLHNAKSIVGPSSGPMHLATLCNCPQLVWSGDANRQRYETHQNPFDVSVNYFDEMGWHPSVDLVIKKMVEFGL